MHPGGLAQRQQHRKSLDLCARVKRQEVGQQHSGQTERQHASTTVRNTDGVQGGQQTHGQGCRQSHTQRRHLEVTCCRPQPLEETA